VAHMKKALVLTCLFAVFAVLSVADDCHLPRPVSDISMSVDDSGYMVTTADREEEFRKSYQPNSMTPIVVSYEDLMSFFDGRVFFLTSSIRIDRWRHGLSRGPTGMLAYKSCLLSVGLDMRPADPWGWVVGSPDALDNVGIYQFTFPWASGLEASGLGTDAGDIWLITSFVNAVLYHESSLAAGGNPARKVAAVGIYPIDDSESNFLVTAYYFSFSQDLPSEPGTGIIMMLSIRPESALAVDCLWISGQVGRLVPEFQEDVDGDGVRDFLFYPGPENNAPSFLLSGKDGSNIASFFGDDVAVGHGPDGTYVVLDHRLYYRIDRDDEADLGLNVYAWVDGVGLKLVPQGDTKTSSTSEKVASQHLLPVVALRQRGVNASNITVYARRDPTKYGVRPEARFVQAADVPAWDFALQSPPGGAFGADAPVGVTPQLVYVPPKFAQWWKEIGARSVVP
jgi:hypothetical protein